jgi:hypothetical protein
MAKETTCKHCNKVFESKGKYDYHFRAEHQKEVNTFKLMYIHIRKFVIMSNNLFVFAKSFILF